jgi:4,5-dihydroxyphthalate decarboxylase
MSGGSKRAGAYELSVAIGDDPRIEPIKSGRLSTPLLKLNFASVAPINRAFAPMVRELKYDVCEMAIGTFIQAKAYNKRIALLPIVTLARFQESALLCRADSAIRRPEDLKGRRVGVRAYSQTTGLWLRGELADDYGVRPESIEWLTFEDAHVAEYRDPPHARRAAPGESLSALLKAGAIDAAIFGADAPDDPLLHSVFPDPQKAARAFLAKHGVSPVNHMVCVKQKLAEARADLVAALMGLFRRAGALKPGEAGDRGPPTDRGAIDSALDLAARYAAEQGLTPRRLTLEEIWRGYPGE